MIYYACMALYNFIANHISYLYYVHRISCKHTCSWCMPSRSSFSITSSKQVRIVYQYSITTMSSFLYQQGSITTKLLVCVMMATLVTFSLTGTISLAFHTDNGLLNSSDIAIPLVKLEKHSMECR